MLFVPRAPSLLPGLQMRVPSIPTTVSTRMFFDKAEVKAALTEMERHSLSRCSLLVRRTAQKSIKKVGSARPRLKVMRDNPGVPLKMLLKLPGISERSRRGVEGRIRELRYPPASPPGSPPYTHVPSSHMLGFRRNLYNGYDRTTQSAVVGPSKKGDQWTIPQLHEFGGWQKLKTWVWKPKYDNYWRPIVKMTTMQSDAGPKWQDTGRTEGVFYPARPFMRPALEKCLPRLAYEFNGAFRAGRVGSP